MAITYTEQYETKLAHVEMKLAEGTYAIDYVVTGPIDSVPTNVEGTMSLMAAEGMSRVGYATFANGASNVRFDAAASVPVVSQASIATQFYNDLQSILV